MRAIEQAADASGLSYDQMMQNAGNVIAEATLEFLGSVEGKRIVILVGTGNNGGDGLVVGNHFHQAGGEVSIYQTKERLSDDPNLVRLRDAEILIANASDDQRSRVLRKLLNSADIIIDSVLGTGFQLPLKGSAKDLLTASKRILSKRETHPIVVAVDCPSGLDCDSGEISEQSIAADLTVTLAAAKPGLFKFPGANYVGKIVVGDIGIPSKQKEISSVKLELAQASEISEWLPQRPRDAHKGTFGRVMMIAGSINYPGAAGLAGIAAYRVGAGLVTMAVPSVIQCLVAPLLLEAVWILLPHELGVINEDGVNVIRDELIHYQSIVIGPGFGLDDTTKAFLRRLFGIDLPVPRSQFGFVHPEERATSDLSLPPCVIDADGLKLIAQFDGWHSYLPKDTVLTPHPGEMAVMTGLSKNEIQHDRIGIAKKWAKKWRHIVVLKGAFTVVAAPDGKAMVIPVASPALARAGTGDVLAGAIGGFRAQGLGAYEAAILGSYVHAKAGEFAAEILGTNAAVMAGDVADAIAMVLSELEDHNGIT